MRWQKKEKKGFVSIYICINKSKGAEWRAAICPPHPPCKQRTGDTRIRQVGSHSERCSLVCGKELKSWVQFIIVSSRYTTIALILLTESQYRGIFFFNRERLFSILTIKLKSHRQRNTSYPSPHRWPLLALIWLADDENLVWITLYVFPFS